MVMRILTALLVTVSLAGLPATALAQRRPGGVISGPSGPSGLSVIGDSRVTSRYRDWQNYTSGVNDLPRSTPASGRGALGSSIYDRQSMTVRSSGRAGHVPTTTALKADRNVRVYSPMSPLKLGSSGGRVAPIRGSYALSNQIWRMAGKLEEERRTLLKTLTPRDLVTSLVPRTPGPYRDEMIKAEKAFREGRYQEARAFSRRRDLSRAARPASG